MKFAQPMTQKWTWIKKTARKFYGANLSGAKSGALRILQLHGTEGLVLHSGHASFGGFFLTGQIAGHLHL